MELKRYFAVIWKWLWLIVLSTLVAAGASYYATSQQPKLYQATATLLVGQSLMSINPNPGDLGTSSLLAQTYVQIARTSAVIEGVIEATGVRMSPEALRDRISANSVPGTQLLEVRVTDSDPERAAVLANEVAAQMALQGPAAEARAVQQQREFAQQQVEDLRRKIEDAYTQLETLQKELESATGAREIADKNQQIADLQKQVDTWRKSYSDLLTILSPRSPNYLTVLDPAKPPQAPFSPNLMLNVGLAALVGLILSTAAAFLFEYLDDTLKTGDDVERTLGVLPVGAIAQIPGSKSSRLISFTEPRSLIAEAYRVLRTNIQFSGVDKPIRRILVTSASPMEGKSVTTANLAIVMAQAGFKTLLMDCDLRKPSQHKIFDVQNNFGLTNSLLVQGSPDGFILPTKIENLRLMTTGAIPPNPSEILGSERMGALLDRLQSEYDLLIIDSPPLLPVADASILTRLTDGVLMVVDSSKTRAELAKRAKMMIDKAGGRLLGVVMNRVDARSGAYYYYYRSYYANDSKQLARNTGSSGQPGGLVGWLSSVTRR